MTPPARSFKDALTGGPKRELRNSAVIDAVLAAGQWFAVTTPGAGGYGPPQDRAAAAPLRPCPELT